MECNEIEQQYEHELIFLEIVANYYFDFIPQSFLVNLSIQIEFSALFRAIYHCKWTNYDAYLHFGHKLHIVQVKDEIYLEDEIYLVPLSQSYKFNWIYLQTKTATINFKPDENKF